MTAWSQKVRYRFGDIDHAGIAYYPKLLHLFHCAFEDWWADALHRPYPKLLDEDKLGFPVVHLDVDFLAPVVYGDEPTVHVGVLRIGKSSVEFAFWLVRQDGVPQCCARITTAAVDMDTMKKREVPQVWRERFAPFAVTDSELPKAR
jgi:YbgC/YbaW family acyl-CoA thioester hydrolase